MKRAEDALQIIIKPEMTKFSALSVKCQQALREHSRSLIVKFRAGS